MFPRVYIITKPIFDHNAMTKFLNNQSAEWHVDKSSPSSRLTIEASGRICYMSYGKGRKSSDQFLLNLIYSGHESVLEHANWTFIIDNVSRAFTHQLVRHRVGFSYSQLSQQYHDESDADFIPPAGMTEQETAIWKKTVRQSSDAYKQLSKLAGNLQEKMQTEAARRVRSTARSVLPNATETTIAVTANARSIRHFLEIRGTIVGDIEMRLVACELLELLQAEDDVLFSDFSTVDLDDGFPLIVKHNLRKSGDRIYVERD